MERGYIKLWRKIDDTGLLQNPHAFTFLGWCLLKASHKPHTVMVGNYPVELEKGQFVFGRDSAAKDLNSTPQRVRTLLKTLINLKIIDSKSTNHYTIISIIKWDTYQSKQPANQPTPNQRSTNDQPTPNHKQECKALKNVKKDQKIGRFTPPTIEEVNQYCLKMEYTFDTENFIAHHETRGWILKGGLPMKSWKAACTTFQKNKPKFEDSPPSQQEEVFNIDDYLKKIGCDF